MKFGYAQVVAAFFGFSVAFFGGLSLFNASAKEGFSENADSLDKSIFSGSVNTPAYHSSVASMMDAGAFGTLASTIIWQKQNQLTASNTRIANDAATYISEPSFMENMVGKIVDTLFPKAQAADYVLDNFGKLAFYHSLRPVIEYSAADFSHRLKLTGEKKMIFDNYLNEVLKREFVIREITDELYKYKDHISDKDVKVQAAKIAVTKIRSAIANGYGKATDRERRAYLKLISHNMPKLTSHTCAMYFSSVLPKYTDHDRVKSNTTQLKELLRKMSEHDLKAYLNLNLAFMDYHSDRNRKVVDYGVRPQEATVAINNFLSQSTQSYRLGLFLKSHSALKHVADSEICANAKSYYDLIISMEDTAGEQLRVNTFPN